MLGIVPDEVIPTVVVEDVQLSEEQQTAELEKAAEPDYSDTRGGLTKSLQAAKRAKKEALARLGDTKVYKVILELHRALNEGKGSVISMLLDKMVELIKQFETFVKEQIDKFVAYVKKAIKKKIEKNKLENQEKLEANAKKKINLDLIGQSVAFNIAVQLFWIGSSWQNTVGTLFTTLTIPTFPLLKVNGITDGTADVIRELASSLEKQLPNLSGLCIPSPATGIPPFPFKGYN